MQCAYTYNPQEFGRPGKPRPLVVWNVPETIRNRQLREEEIVGGLHWPPDDDRDYGDPFDGVPEGHGTQCAILAGGLKSGVARRAGLYLIKAGGAVMNQDGDVVEEDVCADSLVSALEHVLDQLRGNILPRGKTILVIDTRKFWTNSRPTFYSFYPETHPIPYHKQKKTFIYTHAKPWKTCQSGTSRT